MRSATGGELAVLASAAFAVFTRILILDTESNWQDLSNYKSVDWVAGYDVDQDIDQPVSQATFQIRRDSDALSLSPTRTDSLANRKADGVTFQSIVDAGRSIRFEIATLAFGSTPSSGDWKRLFEGTIDTVDDGHDPMVVTARDLGASLVDRWETVAGQEDATASPWAIEALIQQFINVLYGSDPHPTLYTPTSPSFLVKTFAWGVESLMDLLQRLISVIGWDLRFKWDDGTSAFRLTLQDPQRTKTTPDATIGADQYIDVTKFVIDATQVRNFVTVTYDDSTSKARGSLGTSDPTSALRYGRRDIVIQEASDSPIDEASEATTMAAAVLSDLKDPKADQSIEMLPYWPVELHDLLRFTANGVHYNANQDLAVVRLRHTGTPTNDGGVDHRTIVDTRGKPASMTQGWLGREAESPTIIPPSPALPIALAVRADGSVDLSLNGASNQLSWRYAWSTSAMPSDASALAGTVVNSQQATVNIAASLALGDAIYVKAFPFPLASGNGTAAGPAVTGKQTRQNKSTAKTIRIQASFFVAGTNAQTAAHGVGAIAPSTKSLVNGYASLIAPVGVPLTAWRARLKRANGNGVAKVEFYKIDDNESATLIDTLTHSGSGRSTLTNSLSETTDGVSTYTALLTLDTTLATNANDNALLWVEFDYTPAALDQTI